MEGWMKKIFHEKGELFFHFLSDYFWQFFIGFSKAIRLDYLHRSELRNASGLLWDFVRP